MLLGLLYRIIGDYFSYIGDIGDIGDIGGTTMAVIGPLDVHVEHSLFNLGIKIRVAKKIKILKGSPVGFLPLRILAVSLP